MKKIILTFVTMAVSIAALQAKEPDKFTIEEKPCVDIASFPQDADGFYHIFDGTSMRGWRGYGRDTIPAGWSVREGIMCFVPVKDKEEDLIFSCKFRNFILDLDWNISKGGNSGILYLAREAYSITKKGRKYYRDIYVTAPEYQLQDDINYKDDFADGTGKHNSAALYDMIPPKEVNTNPYGQWNHARIIVKDGHVEHWQNGVKVVEYDLWTPEWNRMIDESKFSLENWPTANVLLKDVGGAEHSGYIGLQDHDDPFYVKDVRIKILP